MILDFDSVAQKKKWYSSGTSVFSVVGSGVEMEVGVSLVDSSS